MKTYPRGYFTAPIYEGGTWPPGFIPTLYETWGPRQVRASQVASERRDREMAQGLAHAIGSMRMPGTPLTGPPKMTERRAKGAVSMLIRKLMESPNGLLVKDIAERLELSTDAASARVSYFVKEQERMCKPVPVSIPTGFRSERRHFATKEAADAYLAIHPFVSQRKKRDRRKIKTA
jgi:hypothetical protein